jgi:hypothetical protein
VAEPILCLLRRDSCQGLPQRVIQSPVGTRPDGAQLRFDLRPAEFDRVQVRRIRWQIAQLRFPRGDRLGHPRHLRHAQAIEHHPVAGAAIVAPKLLDPTATVEIALDLNKYAQTLQQYLKGEEVVLFLNGCRRGCSAYAYIIHHAGAVNFQFERFAADVLRKI